MFSYKTVTSRGVEHPARRMSEEFILSLALCSESHWKEGSLT